MTSTRQNVFQNNEFQKIPNNQVFQLMETKEFSFLGIMQWKHSEEGEEIASSNNQNITGATTIKCKWKVGNHCFVNYLK